jgi:hypothetical protein
VLQVLCAQADFHAEIVRDLPAAKQRLNESSFRLAPIFLAHPIFFLFVRQ